MANKDRYVRKIQLSGSWEMDDKWSLRVFICRKRKFRLGGKRLYRSNLTLQEALRYANEFMGAYVTLWNAVNPGLHALDEEE